MAKWEKYPNAIHVIYPVLTEISRVGHRRELLNLEVDRKTEPSLPSKVARSSPSDRGLPRIEAVKGETMMGLNGAV